MTTWYGEWTAHLVWVFWQTVPEASRWLVHFLWLRLFAWLGMCTLEWATWAMASTWQCVDMQSSWRRIHVWTGERCDECQLYVSVPLWLWFSFLDVQMLLQWNNSRCRKHYSRECLLWLRLLHVPHWLLRQRFQRVLELVKDFQQLHVFSSPRYFQWWGPNVISAVETPIHQLA